MCSLPTTRCCSRSTRPAGTVANRACNGVLTPAEVSQVDVPHAALRLSSIRAASSTCSASTVPSVLERRSSTTPPGVRAYLERIGSARALIVVRCRSRHLGRLFLGGALQRAESQRHRRGHRRGPADLGADARAPLSAAPTWWPRTAGCWRSPASRRGPGGVRSAAARLDRRSAGLRLPMRRRRRHDLHQRAARNHARGLRRSAGGSTPTSCGRSTSTPTTANVCRPNGDARSAISDRTTASTACSTPAAAAVWVRDRESIVRDPDGDYAIADRDRLRHHRPRSMRAARSSNQSAAIGC